MMMENFTAPISLPSKNAKKKPKIDNEILTLPNPSHPVLLEMINDPEPQQQVPVLSTMPFLKPKEKESDLYNLSAKRVSTFPLKTVSEISHQESLIGGITKVEYKAPKECTCCAAK
jgi:hypothetical protein